MNDQERLVEYLMELYPYGDIKALEREAQHLLNKGITLPSQKNNVNFYKDVTISTHDKLW